MRRGSSLLPSHEDNRPHPGDFVPRATRPHRSASFRVRGVTLIGLPGTQPYSVVYVASGEQVYDIGLWTQTPGLDARAHALLGSLRFTPPTRSVRSLGLQSERESLYGEPTGERAVRSKAAQAERRAAAMADVEAGLIIEGPHTLDAAPEAVAIASPPTELTHPRKQGPPRCGLTQRNCGIFKGVRGPRRRSRTQPNVEDLHFLELRRTVCSSYPPA